MYGNRFNIANIEFNCEIYGPGRRMVVWFQGCTLGCKGCWNESMWSTLPNELIDRRHLLKMIIDSGCDGTTFLGGEPLQQPENLLWLLRKLKACGIGTMVYTGYEADEISDSEMFSKICEYADILVIGRYDEEERNISLMWRGSENQKIMINKNEQRLEECNQVEIRIDRDGAITCLGYPSGDIEEILNEQGHTYR